MPDGVSGTDCDQYGIKKGPTGPFSFGVKTDARYQPDLRLQLSGLRAASGHRRLHHDVPAAAHQPLALRIGQQFLAPVGRVHRGLPHVSLEVAHGATQQHLLLLQ